MWTYKYLILTFFSSLSIIDGFDQVPCANVDWSEPVQTMRKTNMGFEAPVTTSDEYFYPPVSNPVMPVSFRQEQFLQPPPELSLNRFPPMQQEVAQPVSTSHVTQFDEPDVSPESKQHSQSFTDRVVNRIMDAPMNIFDTVTPYDERVNALVQKVKQITSFGSRRKSALSVALHRDKMDVALKELRAQLEEALQNIDSVDSILEESCL